MEPLSRVTNAQLDIFVKLSDILVIILNLTHKSLSHANFPSLVVE